MKISRVSRDHPLVPFARRRRGARLRILTTLAALAILNTGPVRGADTIIHSFAGAPSDGEFPVGDITVAGGLLYGMTNLGGDSDAGTIYRLNESGGGFQLLHRFSSGSNPSGSLTLDGTTLFGMTNAAAGFGQIFKVQIDGSTFAPLHNFTGGATDGKAPLGSLLLADSTLYGMTQRGGTSDTGTVFRIQADGSAFTLLHSFTGLDGSYPEGSLTLSGSTLFGMTTAGTNGGVIFRLDLNGNNFTVLHTFSGLGDGSNAKGSLIVNGSTLYGTTASGGLAGGGTIFALETDGTNYAVLHDFGGGALDGSLPTGSLTLVNSTLYGTTQTGGAADAGTLFQMATDGTAFELVHAFTGLPLDGASPQGSLTYANGTLFGATAGGGATGSGTVFAVTVVPEPSTAILVLAGGALVLARRFRRLE